MKPETVVLGPMSCTIDDTSIACNQPGGIPIVNDVDSFLSMLDTCHAIPTSSDDAINEAACTSFTAKVYKKNFLKPSSLQDTNPCRWKPGKIPSKPKPGFMAFGHCFGNREELQDLAIPVTME